MTEDHPMNGDQPVDVPLSPEDAAQEAKLAELSEKLMTSTCSPEAVAKFFEESQSVLADLPKVKAAKVVRSWVDKIAGSDSKDNLDVQIALCRAVIDWTKAEKRTFLKHRVEVKLGWILLHARRLKEGMELVDALSYEVKKMEEKVLLVEVHLIQAKLLFEMKNIARSKAALTACRANASSVHITIQLQADIEFTGGVLAAQEKEYHVANSYFQEAYDGYSTVKGYETMVAEAAACMFMMKCMDMKTSELNQMMKAKAFLPLHQTTELSAVMKLADPIKDKNLKEFRRLRVEDDFLSSHPIIKHHLEVLEEELLGDVIVKLLQAYSCCQIAHVATVLNLDEPIVTRKLTNLILDGKLNASMAEDEGVISIEEAEEAPETMRDALEVIRNLSKACDVIEQIAQKTPASKVTLTAQSK